MKLSNNFTVAEFCKSQTAIRKGINNEMTDEQLLNARALAENVLQPIRNEFGVTVINSGFRSVELNKSIGGSERSQHCLGEAADIEVPKISNYELALWIYDTLEFDQLILEFYNEDDPNSGWVHVSYKINPTKNRNEFLRASKVNGKTIYQKVDRLKDIV